MVLPEKYFMAFLAVPLVVMLAIDRQLCRAGVVGNDYLLSRAIITGIVIVCLFVSATFA